MTSRIESYNGQTLEQLPLLGEKEILTTINYLGMPVDEYFVIGGANLVLRGIKNLTPDLDVLVSSDLFESLQQIDGSQIKQLPLRAINRGAVNTTVWVKNESTPIPLSATTLLGDGYYPMSFESHKGKVETVKDVPCIALSEVIAAKSALQRTKDFIDLHNIGRFIGKIIILDLNPLVDPLLKS